MIVAAQEEAVALGHSYIGSEHLLLGVARQDERGSLAAFGVTPDGIRSHVVRIFGRGTADERGPHALPFTPHAKSALEMAFKAALVVQSGQVDPEHVLIALVVEDGAAARILRECDVSPDELQRRLVRDLTSR